jgi:hypothetical protein
MPSTSLFNSVFRAVVETVVPEASTLDAEAWAEVKRLVDDAVGSRPRRLRRQLRLLLGLIQLTPLLRHGRRFTSLSPADRARFLRSLQDHPFAAVRVGFWGLRTLALLGYYAREQATRAIGYAADPRGWDALRRVREAR